MDAMDQIIACSLCGRDVAPGQRLCACGAVLKSEPVQDTTDLGRYIPWFGLVGFVVALWWMISPGRLSSMTMPNLKLYGIVVLLSAVCVMLTARSLQRQKVNIGISPWQWFGLVVVAWPLAMPYFLYAQYRDSQPQRMKFGWVTTGLFIGALLVLWMTTGQPAAAEAGEVDFPEIPSGVYLNRSNPIAPGQAR